MRQIHNSSNIFHAILSLFHYFDFINHIHFCSPIFSNPLTIFSNPLTIFSNPLTILSQSSHNLLESSHNPLTIFSNPLTIFSQSYVLPKIFLKSLKGLQILKQAICQAKRLLSCHTQPVCLGPMPANRTVLAERIRVGLDELLVGLTRVV